MFEIESQQGVFFDDHTAVQDGCKEPAGSSYPIVFFIEKLARLRFHSRRNVLIDLVLPIDHQAYVYLEQAHPWPVQVSHQGHHYSERW
jgi:hypothetical protein